MSRTVSTRIQSARFEPMVTEASPDGKIVPFRLNVLPRHRLYVDAWIAAGGRMGLCAADVGRGELAEIFVWVRENPDPAYVVRAQGLSWVVYDHIRAHKLGVFRNLEDALYCIRPVRPSGPLAA